MLHCGIHWALWNGNADSDKRVCADWLQVHLLKGSQHLTFCARQAQYM